MHEREKWKWSRSVVSDSSWPHGLQPIRLLHPWDFPGKSTGVGCHCLLWGIAAKSQIRSLQWVTIKKRCQVHLIFCICFHKSGYSKPFNDFPLLRTKIPNLKYIQKVLSSLVPVSLHFQVYIVLFFSLVSSWFLPWPVLQVLKSTSYTFLFTIPFIIHLSICS